MKQSKKKHTRASVETDVIQSRKDYAGTEASPYREWLENKGDYKQEHQASEPFRANPDMVKEENGIFYQALIDDERLELIQTVIATLTDRQLDILRMCGNEGRTMENCAAILGISKGTVQKTLDRIRKKITDIQNSSL